MGARFGCIGEFGELDGGNALVMPRWPQVRESGRDRGPLGDFGREVTYIRSCSCVRDNG